VQVFSCLDSRLEAALLSPPFAPSIEVVEERIAQLTARQNLLAHCALNNHLTWQSKYSALTATVAQLKSQVQSLSTEQATLRLHLQSSQRTASQLSVDLESAVQRNRSLESLLSSKNQEFRAKEIEVLRFQGELEDCELKHRHEMAAVERKVGALEMKLEEQLRKRESCAEDRLSGIQKQHRETAGRVEDGNLPIRRADDKHLLKHDHETTLKRGNETTFKNCQMSVLAANISIDEIPATIQDRKKCKNLEAVLFLLIFCCFSLCLYRNQIRSSQVFENNFRFGWQFLWWNQF
jgi:chromosome segregation ATPase